MAQNFGNKEIDALIDLYLENNKLKEELTIKNGILTILKRRGFESEIIYLEYAMRNNLK